MFHTQSRKIWGGKCKDLVGTEQGQDTSSIPLNFSYWHFH